MYWRESQKIPKSHLILFDFNSHVSSDFEKIVTNQPNLTNCKGCCLDWTDPTERNMYGCLGWLFSYAKALFMVHNLCRAELLFLRCEVLEDHSYPGNLTNWYPPKRHLKPEILLPKPIFLFVSIHQISRVQQKKHVPGSRVVLDGTAPRQKLNLSVFGCMEYGIFMIDKLHAPCDVRNIQLDMDEHGPMGHMIIFHRIHPHVPLDLILKRLCCASFKMQKNRDSFTSSCLIPTYHDEMSFSFPGLDTIYLYKSYTCIIIFIYIYICIFVFIYTYIWKQA